MKFLVGIVVMFCVLVGGIQGTRAADGDGAGGGAAGSGDDREFAGIRFGVGLSLTHDTGKRSRVLEAEIVNGVVRIKKESKSIARILLETHYFFSFAKKPHLGTGPFVALQPGTDEIIESIGMGWMVGFRRSTTKNGSSSWNLGVGVIVDPSVTVLGDEVVENQPLPGGETEVRFKETAQLGLLIVASFSF